MRIISGKFRGTKIHSVDGKTSRPTMDAFRESMFSILFDCDGLNVLDLFSGSGSVGLEAFSRGAESITFVEASSKAISTIIKNLEKLRIEEKVKINKKKVDSFLKKNNEKFNLVFMDPPYNKNLVNKTIELILTNDALSEDGVIVIEHSINEKINPNFCELVINEKSIGKSRLTILKGRKNEDL